MFLSHKEREMSSGKWKCCQCKLLAKGVPHSIARAIGHWMATTTGVVTALVISNYDPIHGEISGDGPPGLLKPLVEILEHKFTGIRAPQWIEQPSSTAFTISWAIFALISLTQYHTFRGVRYRDHILLGVCGAGMTLLLILCKKTFLDPFGTYLPCLVQAGLCIVMTLHERHLCLVDEGAHNESIEGSEKDGLGCGGEVGRGETKIGLDQERV